MRIIIWALLLVSTPGICHPGPASKIEVRSVDPEFQELAIKLINQSEESEIKLGEVSESTPQKFEAAEIILKYMNQSK